MTLGTIMGPQSTNLGEPTHAPLPNSTTAISTLAVGAVPSNARVQRGRVPSIRAASSRLEAAGARREGAPRAISWWWKT